MIYLDNAATTLKKPEAVSAAVIAAMKTYGNSARGAHDRALSASRAIFDAREKIARLFGCAEASHVVFTQNATQALNTALLGLFSAGDHVISTDLEHNSVLRPLYHLHKEHGISIDFVPADCKGNIDISDFRKLVRPETKAIVTTHASNLTGNVLACADIGQFARENGLIYILDASQTAGAFPLDMQKQNIDVLCFTGHKSLMGPQGTGGLCIGEGIRIRPMLFGGTGIHSYAEAQPENYPEALEAGTLNGHGLAGLSAAIDYINKTGIGDIHRYETALMRRFHKGVSAVSGVTVYGDFSGDRAPIVTINLAGRDSSEVADILSEEYGIAVRAGAHCAPRMHRALGTEATGTVRFSFGWFNTMEEIDAAIDAVRSIAKS